MGNPGGVAEPKRHWDKQPVHPENHIRPEKRWTNGVGCEWSECFRRRSEVTGTPRNARKRSNLWLGADFLRCRCDRGLISACQAARL